MKKLLIGLFMVMIALSGCSGHSAPTEDVQLSVPAEENTDASANYVQPLNLEQVMHAIRLQGLQVSEKQDTSDNYKLNNVTPAFFITEPNHSILMIYIFDSIVQRKEACRDGGFGGRRLDNQDLKQLLPDNNQIAVGYTAKNALLVGMCDSEQYGTNAAVLFWRHLNAAASFLNGVKEIVFKDRGSHWDARLVVKYYDYGYKDKTDRICSEKYAEEKWLVKYLGPDPESVHHVKYEYKGRSCSGSAGAVPLQKIGRDYYLSMFDSGGTNLPDKDDVYTLAIQWGGNKETLHLKSISE